MIREWTPGQWGLRVTAALGPVLALLATTPAGVPPRAWLVVLVALLSLAHARLPESPVGTVAMGTVVVWWGVAFRGGPDAWAIPAAAALAGYGPDALGVDPATLRRWLVRAGAAFLLAPGVWLVAAVLRDRGETPGVWVTGLALALVAVVAASYALNRGAED